MELDGYAPSLELAFEYQGQQHYSPVAFFHAHPEGFKKRQQDDECKRQLCQKHGVRLLEVAYHIPHNELQNHLAGRLRNLRRGLLRDKTAVQIRQLPGVSRRSKREVLRAETPVKIAQLDAWDRKYVKDLQSIAAFRGGKLLSKSFVNMGAKLLWCCAVSGGVKILSGGGLKFLTTLTNPVRLLSGLLQKADNCGVWHGSPTVSGEDL